MPVLAVCDVSRPKVRPAAPPLCRARPGRGRTSTVATRNRDRDERDRGDAGHALRQPALITRRRWRQAGGRCGACLLLTFMKDRGELLDPVIRASHYQPRRTGGHRATGPRPLAYIVLLTVPPRSPAPEPPAPRTESSRPAARPRPAAVRSATPAHCARRPAPPPPPPSPRAPGDPAGPATPVSPRHRRRLQLVPGVHQDPAHVDFRVVAAPDPLPARPRSHQRGLDQILGQSPVTGQQPRRPLQCPLARQRRTARILRPRRPRHLRSARCDH